MSESEEATFTDTHRPNQVRLARCIDEKENMKNTNCDKCSRSERCITVHQDLAELIEKCKNDCGICEFSEEDVEFLNTNYPEVLVYGSMESQAVEYFIN